MKKILSIIGTITLIATSTTNLVVCDKGTDNENKKEILPEELKKLKEENKINTKNGIL